MVRSEVLPEEPAAPAREEACLDTWKICEDCVVRIHAVPRKKMFIPTAENMQGLRHQHQRC